MQYVNLGCGNHYDPRWVNIDITSTNPKIISHNLQNGIPLADNSCDAVYHSHLIEHFPKKDAANLLKECYRILKPGGILRVATPDLERICRMYLECLDACKQGDSSRDPEYEWMLLEMYDQTVRENKGGEMKEFLHQNSILNQRFIHSRIGIYESDTPAVAGTYHILMNSYKKRGLLRTILRVAGKMDEHIPHPFRYLVLGNDGMKLFSIGKFRRSGEIHFWMYDTYSLTKLLQKTGFGNIVQKNAGESDIPGFEMYHLDVLPDGSIRKPDSFYMEAMK